MSICLQLDILGITETLRKQMRRHRREIWNSSRLQPFSCDRSWKSDRSWPYAQPLEILPCSTADTVLDSQGLELGEALWNFTLWLDSTEPAGQVLPHTSLQTWTTCTNWLILALRDRNSNTSIPSWENESHQPDFSRTKIAPRKVLQEYL